MQSEIPLKSAILLFVALFSLFSASCEMYQEMQGMYDPNYEVGKHQGAKYCAECHEEIYKAWSENSRHAVATSAESFIDTRDKFADNFLLGAMMGEAMCYACHGLKEVNEGVNCETCHGPAIPGAEIEETHEKKYTPGRERLKKPDFCAGCHKMKNPMSGESLFTLFSELEKSPAGKKGATCQGCHMKPREEEGLRYHGFDTATRKPDIYNDDLELKDIKLNFPEFSLVIKNHVTGHAIPASGSSRALTLEMLFVDADGKRLHEIVEIFEKKFSLMPVAGLMPYKLMENTQLQAGEARKLSFSLPSSIKGRIKEARLSMRFYEIGDEHQGDIAKAYWKSRPFNERTFSLEVDNNYRN